MSLWLFHYRIRSIIKILWIKWKTFETFLFASLVSKTIHRMFSVSVSVLINSIFIFVSKRKVFYLFHEIDSIKGTYSGYFRWFFLLWQEVKFFLYESIWVSRKSKISHDDRVKEIIQTLKCTTNTIHFLIPKLSYLGCSHILEFVGVSIFGNHLDIPCFFQKFLGHEA